MLRDTWRWKYQAKYDIDSDIDCEKYFDWYSTKYNIKSRYDIAMNRLDITKESYLFMVELAYRLQFSSRVEESIKLSLKILAFKELSSIRCLNNLTKMYIDLNKREEALKYNQEALKLNYKNKRALDFYKELK